MIVRTSLTVTLLVIALPGCTSNRGQYAIAATGLDSCILKRIDFISGDTPDITKMNFSAFEECKYRFIDSLNKSAGPNCAKLLVRDKSCYYNFKENSVIIHSAGDGAHYTLEFYK